MERTFPAPWKSQGRAAGPRRNLTMFEASHPDLVVAFPGGAGTANMIEIAREAGTKVIEIAQHRMIEVVQ
jgi:predicted Rossmann-fold nucleotide-binding protein